MDIWWRTANLSPADMGHSQVAGRSNWQPQLGEFKLYLSASSILGVRTSQSEAVLFREPC